MSHKNMRHRRDERYRRAVGRQLCLLDQGAYRTLDPDSGKLITVVPAPIEQFLRPSDTVDSCNWRSWARYEEAQS